jgi:hypothetical protein
MGQWCKAVKQSIEQKAMAHRVLALKKIIAAPQYDPFQYRSIEKVVIFFFPGSFFTQPTRRHLTVL